MTDEEVGEVLAVESGTGMFAEDVPLARVVSRLTWPQERSSILNKEGDAVICTSDDPQSLEDVLAGADETHFDMQQAFVNDVFDTIGRDSVQTG